MRTLLALLALAILGAGDPALIHVGTIELHGTLAGEPFWARLLPADRQFGGHRVLQLVYTPPAPAVLAGAALVDHPFILLDPQARIVAWNGRESLTQAVPAGGGATYQVQRELDGAASEVLRSERRSVAPGRAWDLRIAALHLALTWKAGSTGNVPVVDLFGPRHAEAMSATWSGTSATLARVAAAIGADAQGHLASLRAADGAELLSVAELTLLPQATP